MSNYELMVKEKKTRHGSHYYYIYFLPSSVGWCGVMKWMDDGVGKVEYTGGSGGKGYGDSGEEVEVFKGDGMALYGRLDEQETQNIETS